MVIVIDTREQRPWSFPATQVEVRGLKTGDYALLGDEENFAIERKSAEDFAGTISSGWHRFCKELQRMERFAAKVIVVETDFETFCFRTCNGRIIPPDHEHCRVSPQFVMKRIAQLTLRNVSVIFAGNAELGSAIALRIFHERDAQIAEKLKKEQKNADRSNS